MKKALACLATTLLLASPALSWAANRACVIEECGDRVRGIVGPIGEHHFPRSQIVVDPERDALFAQLVAQQYQHGEAMNMATALEIDAVIDPADTRAWLARGLASARVAPLAHRFVDTW